MEKRFRSIVVFFLVLLGSVSVAWATNGDNLIAIGPIARAMGGVGIAAPQDAISAVFANPAAMCFGPYCPSTEVDFAGTGFMPRPDAKVYLPGQTIDASSDRKIYPIPAIGLSVPITSAPPFWRFGLAAYGVTGLGVDYRDSSLDQSGFYNFGPFGQFPLVAGDYTELSIMKFAPAIAFQPHDQLSFGLALHIDYANLDLQEGGSSGLSLGAQLGMIYKVNDYLSLGLNYVTPQNVDHDNVVDFDGDGDADRLKLEMPQQLGFGAAVKLMGDALLVEANVKWINWADANGYDEFDWDNQWVFALGAQYKPLPKLALRAGYNYGANPVQEHEGFVGAIGAPGSLSKVQGKTLPTYYYETFRVIGFPAIVEHHLTAGIGYEFTPNFAVNLAYMHAFEKTLSESGTNLVGQPVKLESTLSENSLEFGVTWRF
jgi:long-chain fatty acid transport protein